MRVAPAAEAVSRSSGPWLRVQQLLWALAMAVAAAWAVLQLQFGATVAVGAALASATIAAALAGLRPATECRLRWDGAVWTLQRGVAGADSGQAVPMIDLGSWILVRFAPGGHWLALSRRDAADWQALRVALHGAARPRPGA